MINFAQTKLALKGERERDAYQVFRMCGNQNVVNRQLGGFNKNEMRDPMSKTHEMKLN